ncbi:MAG: trimethylamine methyltransferase family protein [Salipiger marinus]|uniref:trimethylamine methyltransferase family protein n=1 Tax=Salipiger marinus TaxID=555512 RepID=UPI004057E945
MADALMTRDDTPHDLLDDGTLRQIEAVADRLLAEVGVNFINSPDALARWSAAGAQIEGERVRLAPELVASLCAKAPARFVQTARTPERSVEIGGKTPVMAPVYGPIFVQDAARGRRFATLADFRDFVKLAQMAPALNHSGGTICEPTDVPVNSRHLDMLLAHMTLSDKPFMGAVTEPAHVRDSLDMARILFGPALEDGLTVLAALISVGSPLCFDETMTKALELYAAANQACIVAPFLLPGATAPETVGGTLAQMLAEVRAGVAYAQLIRPGAPVIFGPFVASVDAAGGAARFDTAEAVQITRGAGQLARRMRIPFRCGGALTGAALPDAQAGYEAARGLAETQAAGVDFILHACGWLDGGLVADFEKFVMDANQLETDLQVPSHSVAEEGAAALDLIRDIGPGGHFVGRGAAAEDPGGAAETGDAMERASAQVRHWLESHNVPPLPEDVETALRAFVARRKAEIGPEI